MPALRDRRWTLEQLEELIERREGLTPRYELVDGELLVTPAPSDRHQRIVLELYVLIRAYVLEHRLGEVRLGPSNVTLDPATHFEPDLFVVPAVNGPGRRRTPSDAPSPLRRGAVTGLRAP